MIPLFSAQAAHAGVDIEAAIQRVIRSHWYVLGPEVGAFETEFADHVGSDHCISLANGTDALELALRIVGVGRGDLVMCAANAGFYGSTAVHAIGAIPLYVDVDAKYMTLSPAAVEAALTVHRPQALIVTHLYGQLAQIEALAAIARQAGVPLIEDCAQAHGARRDGRLAGSFGDVGCFSFYPTKNLGALGDGGALVTSDPALATAARTLRQYGWSAKYHVATPHGCNSRLDELQAAVLREKLPHLDRWNAQRRAIALRYNAAFADLPITTPASTGDDYVAHLYVVRVKERAAFREHLRAWEVATDVHYPVPDHHQAAYPHARTAGALTVTESAAGELVTLPCFPGLTDAEVARVVAAVRSYFGR